MKHNKCCHCFRRWMLLFGKAVGVRPLYRNALLRHFCCEWDQSAASQVIFFIYLQNAFPFPIIRINTFSQDKNHLKRAYIFLCELRDLYSKFGISITRFSCDTWKCALKTGRWKPSFSLTHSHTHTPVKLLLKSCLESLFAIDQLDHLHFQDDTELPTIWTVWKVAHDKCVSVASALLDQSVWNWTLISYSRAVISREQRMLCL